MMVDASSEAQLPSGNSKWAAEKKLEPIHSLQEASVSLQEI